MASFDDPPFIPSSSHPSRRHPFPGSTLESISRLAARTATLYRHPLAVPSSPPLMSDTSAPCIINPRVPHRLSSLFSLRTRDSEGDTAGEETVAEDREQPRVGQGGRKKHSAGFPSSFVDVESPETKVHVPFPQPTPCPPPPPLSQSQASSASSAASLLLPRSPLPPPLQSLPYIRGPMKLHVSSAIPRSRYTISSGEAGSRETARPVMENLPGYQYPGLSDRRSQLRHRISQIRFPLCTFPRSFVRPGDFTYLLVVTPPQPRPRAARARILVLYCHPPGLRAWSITGTSSNPYLRADSALPTTRQRIGSTRPHEVVGELHVEVRPHRNGVQKQACCFKMLKACKSCSHVSHAVWLILDTC